MYLSVLQDFFNLHQLVLVYWSLEGHFHIGWYFCVVTLVPEVPASGAIVTAIVAVVVLVKGAIGTVILVIFIFLVIWIIILTFVIGVMDVLSLVDFKFLVVTADINVIDLIAIRVWMHCDVKILGSKSMALNASCKLSGSLWLNLPSNSLPSFPCRDLV